MQLDPPHMDRLVALISRLWPAALPQPGDTPLLVGLSRRGSRDPAHRPGKWDDLFTVLRSSRHWHRAGLVDVAPWLRSTFASFSPYWWTDEWIVGTTEPGLAPMMGTGRIATHSEGVARVCADQHVPDALYLGYHRGDQRHPAGRQNRPMLFERWRGGAWHAHAPDGRRYGGPDDPHWQRGLNYHRGRWSLDTQLSDYEELGDYDLGDRSHACAVAMNRAAHWRSLNAFGWTGQTPPPLSFGYLLIDVDLHHAELSPVAAERTS